MNDQSQQAAPVSEEKPKKPNIISRFFSWWLTTFRRQKLVGKIIFGLGSLCIVCFVFSLCVQILRPSPPVNIEATIQARVEATQAAQSQTVEVTQVADAPASTPEATNTPIPTDTPNPTDTPTIEPTPTETPTEAPTEITLDTATEESQRGLTAGIGISRDTIQGTYENTWDFTFEEAVEVDGQPRVMGTAPNKLAIVELIGPDENLVSASVLIFLPNNNPEAVTQNTFYMLQMLSLVAPDWSDGTSWITDNLKTAQEQGEVKTTYGDIDFTLSVAEALGMVSLSAKPVGQTDSVAAAPTQASVETDTPVPPTSTPMPEPPTPVHVPAAAEIGVEKAVGLWGLKLYDMKRAKAVWFYGDGTYAQGVWLIAFVEFKNNGSGTRAPAEDMTFYFVDDKGQRFDAGINDGTLGAAHQFTAGHYYDDIGPGLILGVALPVDTPLDLGPVWLKVEEDPNFSIYLGKANEVALVDG